LSVKFLNRIKILVNEENDIGGNTSSFVVFLQQEEMNSVNYF